MLKNSAAEQYKVVSRQGGGVLQLSSTSVLRRIQAPDKRIRQALLLNPGVEGNMFCAWLQVSASGNKAVLKVKSVFPRSLLFAQRHQPEIRPIS